MNDTPIQIRNPEVVRAIRELAETSGRPITEVVADAVNAELQRRRQVGEDEFQRRLAGIREAARQIQALPRIGPLLTDDDIYDEDGLPK